MAEESLRITITADNKDAVKKIQDTILALDGVEKSAGNTGKGVKKLGTDFTGVSRVIQDLPFGFMAIQNNLTQLLPAAGAAGLAFSALMAGIQFAQVGLTYWTRGVKEADEAMSASTKALTDFNVQLQNSKNDFAAVRAGVLSKKEALDRYNDTLGKSVGYAKSIEEAEALMVKNTATVVKAMNLRTQAQLFQAKAAELQAKIASGEIFNLSMMEQALVGIKGAFNGVTGVMKAAGTEMSTRFSDANAQIKQFDKLSQDALTKAIELEKGLAGTRTAPTNVGATKTEKPKVDTLKEETAELERQIQAYKNLKFAMMGQGTIMPEREQGKDLEKLKLTTQGNSALNQVMLQRNQIEEQRVANLELANNLTNTAMNSLNGLANAMMNGQNIGQALGDMFKRLAIDIALAAAKAAIFQAILSAVSGGTAGAAGKGGFLKGFGKLLGFSEGGTVTGPRSGYPVMLHGTEHIVRPDQMRSIIASAAQMGGGSNRVIVEGRISGNDIFISQKRTSTFRALTT
jgi:hypothetical protein